MNQWYHAANTRSRRQAWENTQGQVAMGFDLACDWLSEWREYFEPITGRSDAEPRKFRIFFDTQLKTAS